MWYLAMMGKILKSANLTDRGGGSGVTEGQEILFEKKKIDLKNAIKDLLSLDGFIICIAKYRV